MEGIMLDLHRQCAVQIHNDSSSYLLCSPEVYLDSGRCQDALTPTIVPHQHGSGLFTKTPGTARGSVGVFTYDLYNDTTKKVEKKMAVMFQNPFDFNLYSNLFAAGLFDRNQVCDESLYDKMCHKEGPEFYRRHAGSDLIFKGDGVIISASMTDTDQPKLDVNINSTND